jgi:hypothetical protein
MILPFWRPPLPSELPSPPSRSTCYTCCEDPYIGASGCSLSTYVFHLRHLTSEESSEKPLDNFGYPAKMGL